MSDIRPISDATLAKWMEPEAVDWDVLHQRHGPLLGLVKNLLGIVPNCDRYLEIWPTGFRTYNLMVPNFLNLPQMIFGIGAPKDLVGLSLYASSMASECSYCSSHCCSFAMRRGASAESMMGGASPAQQAVLDFADALGRMPHSLTPDHIRALQKHLSPDHVEWIAMGAAMMGFLNKFMDAVGVPLEEESMADAHAVMVPAGWLPKHHVASGTPLPASVKPPKDGLGTFLSVLKLAPGALKFDRTHLAGVPSTEGKARAYLREQRGIDEPLLDRIGLDRTRRALTAMLAQNLDPDTMGFSRNLKAQAAYLFAEFADNDHRRAVAEALAEGGKIDDNLKASLKDLAYDPTPATDTAVADALAKLTAKGMTETNATALILTRAAAPSSAETCPAVIEAAKAHLTPAQGIELMTWVSVQQLAHRLDVYYETEAIVG